MHREAGSSLAMLSKPCHERVDAQFCVVSAVSSSSFEPLCLNYQSFLYYYLES
ncbi:hypothetical protein VDIAB_30344 [Vibrio diabolicus]|nr:hypothetical protein VDIAB_30344 [Vibrio diabolicus]